MNKPILILGASGFIGQKLTLALSQKFKLRCFDKYIHPNLKNIKSIEWLIGDFRDEELMAKAVCGCSVLIHLISTTTHELASKDPYKDCESNVLSSIKIFELAGIYGIQKIIFSSSGGAIYGLPLGANPTNEESPTWPITPYGIQKAAIEKYLYYFSRLYNLKAISLRVANPYGMDQFFDERRQGVIDIFLQKAIKGIPLDVWGDGTIARDYVHIDDVIDAFLKAIAFNSKLNFEIFNIGTGKEVTLNSIIEIIKSFTNVKVNYLEGRNFDVPLVKLNCNKASELLLWSSKIELLDGISKTYEKLKISSF